ncbi:MAG TPA: hypothetical protein VF761_03480 [Gemmatimonadaceae bacterium]
MMRRVRLCLIAAGALSLAACNADPTAPKAGVTDQMLTRDIAAAAATTATLDLAQMVDGELAAGLPATASQTALAPACPYSPAGRYVCPTVRTPDGLLLDRSYAIFAGGTPQPAYDPLRTDSVNFQTAVNGTLARDDRTLWLRHTRSMTVSGLAGIETTRVWDGIGARSDSMRVTRDGAPRTTRIEAMDRIEHVVFRLPRATYPYPQSGTITQDIVITSAADGAPANEARSATRHVVVTFNGTRKVGLLIGATPCTLDLETRAVSCGR